MLARPLYSCCLPFLYMKHRSFNPPLFAILFTLLLLNCSTSADSETFPEGLQLTYISSFDLDIEDPSGLAIDSSGDFLWTVSDSNGGHIYMITFDGQIIGHLPYEGNDMEGITMDPRNETLWVAEERFRTILQFNRDGNLLEEVHVPVTANELNEGLEGIAINPENGHIYIVNQKNPIAFIELDEEMTVVRNVDIDFEMPYSVTDLSGLFYDTVHRQIWMVSDESQKIVVTDLDLNPIHYFDLDRIKFEGIALDLSSDTVYLVNDEENKLYVFRLE